jgi:hypothetical protein
MTGENIDQKYDAKIKLKKCLSEFINVIKPVQENRDGRRAAFYTSTYTHRESKYALQRHCMRSIL